DHRCGHRLVAHPRHQVLDRRTRRSGEHVPCVSQVVEVQPLVPGPFHSLLPAGELLGIHLSDRPCRPCRMPDAGCRMPDAGCRMPDAGIMPTGTITREDACTWLDAGAVVL